MTLPNSTAVLLAAAAHLLFARGAVAQSPIPPIPEQPDVWKSITVGGGGFIPGIVFSRAEKGLAYLRSDMGGAYRWEDAKGGGGGVWIPLQDNLAESSYQGIESVAPDPVDPNTVYLAAGMYHDNPAAFLRSRDRGTTWKACPVPIKMGGNEDGRGVGERLAVDPNSTNILYFASRQDGLLKSTDGAATWQKVESFPYKGSGPFTRRPMATGLSFVVFDKTSGSPSSPTKTLFVGHADPGDNHLFRSDDAGVTWAAVAGGPPPKLLALKAEIDDDGESLYLTYGDATGPNGVKDGAVYKLDVKTNQYADITPDKRPDKPGGGYTGISLDRQQKGTLAVTTMNRWGPVDTVWRSVDGGVTWHDIHSAGASRDVSETPFLLWGDKQAKLGWWMSALAIDPFNSNRAAYATGATIYATTEFAKVSDNAPTAWKPWVQGIEQTAIISLMSPSAGPHLFSAFGDISGFTHPDFERSPDTQYVNPVFGNTNTLDYAALAPHIITRTGTGHGGGSGGEPSAATMALSTDSGATWKPLFLPKSDAPAPEGQRRRGGGGAGNNDSLLTPRADGKALLASHGGGPVMISEDLGQSWSPVAGLPKGVRIVADRVSPQKLYGIDFPSGKLFASTDGGKSFADLDAKGLPNLTGETITWREQQWPLFATLGREGDLWYAGKTGLFHSADAGQSFTKVDTAPLQIDNLSQGKGLTDLAYPSLFAIGRVGDLKALFRSDDAAKTWVRINDKNHEWGRRFRCIAGDPRLYGRVYIGTDGRGILYGDIGSTAK